VAKLWEHIASGDLPAVHTYVVEQILPGLKDSERGYRLGSTRNTTVERTSATVGLVRGVWKHMYDHGEPPRGAVVSRVKNREPIPHSVTRLYRGTMEGVVSTLAGGALTKNEVTQISKNLIQILNTNQIAVRVAGKVTPTWQVRRFEPREILDLSRSSAAKVKPDWREEKRIKEEEEKDRPVKTSYTFPTIPPIPADLDGMRDWAKDRVLQMRDMFDRYREASIRQAKELEEMAVKLTELEERVNGQAAGKVADEVNALIAEVSIFSQPKIDKVADRIEAAIRQAGPEGITRTELDEKFSRHLDRRRLDELIRQGRVTIREEATAGRPAQRLIHAENAET
jgi:hypothetical protein